MTAQNTSKSAKLALLSLMLGDKDGATEHIIKVESRDELKKISKAAGQLKRLAELDMEDRLE